MENECYPDIYRSTYMDIAMQPFTEIEFRFSVISFELLSSWRLLIQQLNVVPLIYKDIYVG